MTIHFIPPVAHNINMIEAQQKFAQFTRDEESVFYTFIQWITHTFYNSTVLYVHIPSREKFYLKKYIHVNWKWSLLHARAIFDGSTIIIKYCSTRIEIKHFNYSKNIFYNMPFLKRNKW